MTALVPAPRRARVLLLAERCNPEWASVPLVGWSHARALSEVADVHLVTQIRNRDALLRAGLQEGTQFTAVDSEPVAARLHRLGAMLRGGNGGGWTTEVALLWMGYPYFEHLVRQRFGAAIVRGRFDLVHRLTPVSPTTPSPLAAFCRAHGVPFVVGPINGGVAWPRAFDSARRLEKEWLSYLREGYKLLPGFQSTRQNSAALLIGSRDTWRQTPHLFRRKCVYLPENAVDLSRFQRVRQRRAARPLRAVFVGRLVPYKGADMLLSAAAPLIRSGDVVLDVVGDGPQMKQLRGTVAQEQIGGGVKLHGWVQHQQVQDILAECDVFTFPSIREFGGGVVLEAMAVGVPPIAMDYAGPAELVTDETGFLIPMGTREEIIERLRRMLAHLVQDPREIDRRSPVAVQRVRNLFTWQAKARQVLEVYRWVLGERDAKPDFGMPLVERAGEESADKEMCQTS
jgi:glycosyltransferase involved in cell wall biosynthesis